MASRTDSTGSMFPEDPGEPMLPVIKADSRGRVHLAWMNEKPEVLYSVSNGSEWSTPANGPHRRRSVRKGDASAYPSMAVDSSGIVHLAWMEFVGETVDICYSQLSEGKWTTPRNLSGTKGISQRPKIAVDSLGTVHVVWYDNTGGFFQLYHVNGDGMNWSKPANTKLVDWFVTDNPSWSLSPGLAADAYGNIHMVWVDVYDMTQDPFHSCWNGKVWSKPNNISRSPERPREPVIEADSAGNLHVAWQDEGRVFHSDFDGKEWSKPAIVSSGRLPALGAIPSGGMCITWTGRVGGRTQVFYRQFDRTKWLEAEQVTDTKGTSYAATISIDDLGVAHIAWMDDTPGNIEILYLMRKWVRVNRCRRRLIVRHD